MEAIFPDAKYEEKARLQCYDLSNLTILTMLNLQFCDCQVVTVPLVVRMFYYIPTVPYLLQ